MQAKTSRPASACLLCGLALLLMTQGVSAADGEPAAMAAVLQPQPAAWKMTGTTEAVEIGGTPALKVTARTFTLAAADPVQAPVEVVVRIRFDGAKDGWQWVRLTAGEVPEGGKRAPVVAGLTWKKDTTRLNGSLHAAAEKATSFWFETDGIGDRALNWPEDFRRIIEARLASLTDPAERWFDWRMQLRPDGVRVYLDDRLGATQAVTADGWPGPLLFQATPGVSISLLAVRPLDVADSSFVSLPIAGHLNARDIAGKQVAPDALPRGDRALIVDGVPFDLPAVDAAGDDHIDLGVSWVPATQLAGHFPTRGASISGRWNGAMVEDGMRIQFAIPTARYRAVHLLAAFDGEPDNLPIVSAQFYRAGRGFPESFTTPAPVPAFTASGAGLSVATADGGKARLHHVVIPVEVGKLAAFDGVDDLELELTKSLKVYRAFPDPFYYTVHGGGLPSGVRVFAVTLERPQVELVLKPNAFADTWTAPEKPTYQVTLTNRSAAARTVELVTTTQSWLTRMETEQKQKVNLAGGQTKELTLTMAPPCYGYHDLVAELRDGKQVWREQRGLVYLHEDTREREDWQPGRGPIFGFWNWRGGHDTPSGAEQVDLMGRAGAGSSSGSFESAHIAEAEKESARRWKMITFKAFGAADHYYTAAFANDLAKDGLEAATAKFVETMKKNYTGSTDINRPELMSFFPEPHLGPISYATPPQYYGGEPYVFDEREQKSYDKFLAGFVEGVKVLHQHYPDVKPMLPHGDPLFPIPFVTRSPEARAIFKGIAVDIPVFERLPEQQIHQVSLHRMYFCRDGLNQVGITNPTLAMYEGPSRKAGPGALTDAELADFSVRDSLLLFAYGVDRQVGGWAPFESASWWGEQHYGGGVCHRLPRGTPRPAFAAFATMTRHLDRRNFTGWIPTGSLGVYDFQFTHYRTGEKLHVLYTLRGTRPITFALPDGAKISAFDLMDNPIDAATKRGKVTLTLTTSPIWVYGLTGSEEITLGEPDHRDAAPSRHAKELASLGDGTWKQSNERDMDYEKSHDEFVRRFPGRMTVQTTKAPGKFGGKALAVRLDPQQDSEQKFMPFYTTLVPSKPLVIPGKGSHLGLWVKGASDWGRVVYVVRDGKGERWISVGTGGQWNNDDIYNWSVFCFDGWRYLRFELPASSGWDSFREQGTVWWGSYGGGDDIVDLPLTLEKVIVERRTHAMHVIDSQPCDPADVLLGDLYVEYEHPADTKPEAVRLAQLRMPIPEGTPDLDNPVARMVAEGVAEAIQVTEITLPAQEADGTRCFVHFPKVEGAKRYEVWVSPYPDGRGALLLGKNWTEPGQQIRGLRPDTKFYVFVRYFNAEDKPSKLSSAYEVVLKDMFGMK